MESVIVLSGWGKALKNLTLVPIICPIRIIIDVRATPVINRVGFNEAASFC